MFHKNFASSTVNDVRDTESIWKITTWRSNLR